MIRIAITQECFCRHLRALSEGENGRPEPPTNRSGQRTLKREGWDVDSGNNSSPSVDVKRPAIQPEARFPQLSCAGDAIRSEKPPAVHHSRGFRFAEGAQRALAAFSGLLIGSREQALAGFLSRLKLAQASPLFLEVRPSGARRAGGSRSTQSVRVMPPALSIAFPGEGIGGSYTASPSNTALHRSRMLAERAFGQLASV